VSIDFLGGFKFYSYVCCVVGVDHVFDDGLSLLHIACISQNFAAVQCLVSAGVDPHCRDTHGQSTLYFLVFFTSFTLCRQPVQF